ncbi:MAG: aminoacyl-tRNA hydrolase [Bdellovibrionota bacterium]
MSVKQVILIRRDLNMRRGKEIAQGAHASMGFLVEQLRKDVNQLSLSAEEQEWIREGMAKICLQVTSEAELLACHEKAKAAGLYSFLVRDSGRTEFHGEPTYTACAIGPAEAAKIDAVTGELSLY